MDNDSIPTNIGIVVIVIFFITILSLPGYFIFKLSQDSYKKELINEICNKYDGKYDFCVLNNIEKTYTIKKGFLDGNSINSSNRTK